MSWIDKVAASLGYTRYGRTERWVPVTVTESWTGARITPEQSMRVSAVMACVKIIAETIGSLPLNVYEGTTDGGKRKLRDHPMYRLLHRQPNAWQTSMELREQLQGHLCLRGNAYCRILSDQTGYPVALIPMHPDQVTIERDTNTGFIVYIHRNPSTAQEKRYAQQDILHIRGYTLDGVKGLSPIGYAADAIGLAISAERFGTSFYRNGASVGNVLEHPNVLGEPALKHLKESLEREYTGPSQAGKTLILEEGMKWQRMGLNPEEGQFIESRKFQIQDIARIFRVPPHKLADLERATFSNIEHQAIEFVTDCIRPWCVRWEQALRRDLFAEDEDVFPEFLLDGLLRGDAVARSSALAVQFQNGVLSQNEWREIENRNPIEDGDRYYVSLNLGSDNRPTSPKTLEAWGGDIGERIAAAEERAIERRVSGGPYSQTFGQWVAEWYAGKHAGYVRACLAGLMRTVQAGPDRVDALVGLLIRRPMEAYPGMDGQAVLEDIKGPRVAEIAGIIRNEVCNA